MELPPTTDGSVPPANGSTHIVSSQVSSGGGNDFVFGRYDASNESWSTTGRPYPSKGSTDNGPDANWMTLQYAGDRVMNIGWAIGSHPMPVRVPPLLQGKRPSCSASCPCTPRAPAGLARAYGLGVVGLTPYYGTTRVGGTASLCAEFSERWRVPDPAARGALRSGRNDACTSILPHPPPPPPPLPTHPRARPRKAPICLFSSVWTGHSLPPCVLPEPCHAFACAVTCDLWHAPSTSWKHAVVP